MSAPSNLPRVDDLQYDWPVDILHYESKYLLGLNLQDLMFVALPGIGPMLFNRLGLGVVGAVLGYLLVRKFEGLGDRNVLAYLLAKTQDQTVTLPLILPSDQVETVVVTDLDGNELARIGGGD
jgi:hypothetical protein